MALGGGSALRDGRRGPLDEYILGLTGKARPRVCYLGTAGGDAAFATVNFYSAYAYPRCQPSHLPLFSRPEDLRGPLLDQDLIFVGGGNTANLLAIWRLHGVDALLREAWERGAVLAGVSAGSLCWFEAGVTDSFGPQMAPLRDGLGWLPGSNCPHYDSEAARRPLYRRLVREGAIPAGLAADDGVGLHFEGRELKAVVADGPGAAYRVSAEGEERLEAGQL